jgi:hypothetical protein
MAFGLYVMQDGSVMVAYGHRRIRISCAQYKANGYRPALEKLAVKSLAGHKSKNFSEPAHSRDARLAH